MSEELLAQLQTTQSSEERMLIIARAMLDGLPGALQAAVRAAAICHWFNVRLLAALLSVPAIEADRLYTELQNLPFIEPFPRYGHNVHALMRHILLQSWWDEHRKDYAKLSARAAAYLGQSLHPDWQIECAYHLLAVDEARGITVLQRLCSDWHSTLQDDLVYSLAQAGVEHVVAGRIGGVTGATALFWIGTVEVGRRHLQEAQTAFRQALDWARSDLGLLAACLSGLGDVHNLSADSESALKSYDAALGIYQGIGDRQGEAVVLEKLGSLYLQRSGRRAIEYYQRASALLDQSGDRRALARVLGDLGRAFWEKGELRQAHDVLFQALAISRDTDDRWTTQSVLHNLGRTILEEGQPQRAQELLGQALALAQEMGDRRAAGKVLVNLGRACLASGQPEQSEAYLMEALAISQAVDDLRGVTEIRRLLGLARTRSDGLKRAKDYLSQELETEKHDDVVSGGISPRLKIRIDLPSANLLPPGFSESYVVEANSWAARLLTDVQGVAATHPGRASLVSEVTQLLAHLSADQGDLSRALAVAELVAVDLARYNLRNGEYLALQIVDQLRLGLAH